MNSPVALGTLSDTIGAPAAEIAGKCRTDVIARSNVGIVITQTGTFPEDAWNAMSGIDEAATNLARSGVLRTCVRTFRDPTTSENGAIVLFYKMM